MSVIADIEKQALSLPDQERARLADKSPKCLNPMQDTSGIFDAPTCDDFHITYFLEFWTRKL